MTQFTPTPVRSGPCRGVVVLLPPAKAVPGQIVRVAGWILHRVTRRGKRLVLVPCGPSRIALAVAAWVRDGLREPEA